MSTERSHQPFKDNSNSTKKKSLKRSQWGVKKALRLNLQLPKVTPQSRLMSLKQFLKKKAQADNPLIMSINSRQSMAIANIKSPKSVIMSNGWVIEITKRRCVHTNPMKWDNIVRRRVILLQLWRIQPVSFDHVGNFSVAWEAQHDLINDILKHEILIVIGGC